MLLYCVIWQCCQNDTGDDVDIFMTLRMYQVTDMSHAVQKPFGDVSYLATEVFCMLLLRCLCDAVTRTYENVLNNNITSLID